MSLINIAPLGKVLFSSRSKWSTENDVQEIVLPNSDKEFSFHTDQENNPWLIIDLMEEYPITKIRVRNRLKSCQEKARTLRIEKLLYNSCSSSEIFFDTTESWGQIIEIPVNNVKCRLLKFSLKEYSCFHLKQIEIFTNIENFEHFQRLNYHCEALKNCLTTFDSVFDCYTQTNNLDEIFFYNSDKDKYVSWHKYVKYRLCKQKTNYVLRCDIRMAVNNEDLLSFLLIISKKYQLSVTANYDAKIITLSTKFVTSLKDQIKILFTNLFETLNKGVKALTEDTIIKFDEIKKTLVIIDTDKIYDYGGGFADRLRGVLSLIENCKSLGLDYLIKFTKPYNLNKYYSFNEYLEKDKDRVSNHSQCAIKILSGLSSEGIEHVLSTARKKYEYITIYSHVLNYFDKNTFNDNFKKTEYFNNEYQKYKNILGNSYVSISFRFVNSLGDFKDTSSWNQTLCEEQQQCLMMRCKDELKEFIKANSFNKVLVLSDSSKFLNFIKDIPSVYVFPDYIAHVGKHDSKSDNDEKCFLKTLIDFHLIADAKESYRFLTEHLYHSAFPRVASMCAGRKVIEHKFDL